MTLQHVASERFLDAHLTDTQDFRVVTRPWQDNDTQRWLLNIVGYVNVIHQASNGRQLTAYQSGEHDFGVVTRPPPDSTLPPGLQEEITPRWVVLDLEDGSVAIRDFDTLRYLDAHLVEAKDFRVVMRPPQDNATQRWHLDGGTNEGYRITQQSKGRFLDAYQNQAHDFHAVTRLEQPHDTQLWYFSPRAMIVTLRQKANNRFLDAHQKPENNTAVTRGPQYNDTQRWVMMNGADNQSVALRQLSSGGFLDEENTADFHVYARPPVADPDYWSLNFAT